MKKIIISTFIGLAVLLGSNSCTKDFAEMNTDPVAFNTLNQDQYAGLYLNAERYIYTSYQYQLFAGLHTDLFAQFYANCVTTFNTDRYNFNTSYVWNPFNAVLVLGNPSLKNIMRDFEADTPEYALAQLMYVYGMHHLVDFVGTVPYTGQGEGKVVDWQDCKTVYHLMIEDLDHVIDVLKSADKTMFAKTDKIYNGDLKKFCKFAASMKLRLGMRLVNVEPEFAKTTCESAYAAGVLVNDDDSALYTTIVGGADKNGGNVIGRNAGWNEFCMSATMLSYLKGYNDPRLSVYFQPAVMTGQYAGIRNGLSVLELTENDQNKGPYNSNVGETWITYNEPFSTTAYTEHQDAKFVIMPVSEVYFLRAEGALRGWNMGGTAKELYNEGIRKSMAQWKVSTSAAETYLNGTTDPAAPGDFMNSPAVTTNMPVKFNDGGSLEYKLQQIITQKWLCLYGGASPEAWAEFRRTGYPTLYPVVHSDNPDLPAGTFIQRERIPLKIHDTNLEGYEQAIQMIGGKDSEAVKLYWAK